MKKIHVVLAALVLLAMPTLAHPPADVEMTYDPDSRVLTVEITHGVNNASRHYVNKVMVQLGGNKIIEQTFGSQADSQGQRAVYTIIDAREGDSIAVTAHCNVSGRKSSTFVVPGAGVGPTTE